MTDDRPKSRLDDDEILGQLGAALRAGPAGADPADDPSASPPASLRARVLAAAEREAFGAPARLARLWPRGRATPVTFAAVASLAIAASFAVWGRVSAEPAIPPYEAELATADVDLRGADDSADAPSSRAPLRLSGERFVLVARPTVEVHAPVSARAFLFRAGTPLPWNPPLDVGPEGVVRIAGKTSELLPAGHAELEVVVAVGADDRLPTDAAVARRAVASPTPGFRAVSLRFTPSP